MQPQNTSFFTKGRALLIVVCVGAVVWALLYTEHSSVRSLKNLASLAGLIDSHYSITGITDVRSVDHTIGDADADLVLLEYSDFSCVLCAAMQDNLQQFVREKKALLVSRHLYLSYSGSGYDRAIAAECAGKHGDDDAYRAYMDFLYTNQHKITDDAQLTKEAIALDVDAAQFASCRESDYDIVNRIQRDSEEGFALGAKGTPYIIVVYQGVPVGVSYANEYSAFIERIDTLLQQYRNTL